MKIRKNCIGCGNFLPDEPYCIIPEIQIEYYRAVLYGDSQPSDTWKTDGTFCGYFGCAE